MKTAFSIFVVSVFGAATSLPGAPGHKVGEPGGTNFTGGAAPAAKFGVHEIVLEGNGAVANPFDIWDGTTDPKWAEYLGELKPSASMVMVPPLFLDERNVRAGWPDLQKLYEEHARLGIEFIPGNDLNHGELDMLLAEFDAAVRKAVRAFPQMRTIMLGVEADGGSGPHTASRPRDYALRVRVAYRAVKAERRSCRVAVGGTGGSANSYNRRPEEGTIGPLLRNPGYFDAVFRELERLEKIERNPKSYDWNANPLKLSKKEFELVFSPDAYDKYQDVHHISLFVHDHRKYRDEEHLGVVRAAKALLYDYGYRDTEVWITQAGTHSGTIKSRFQLGPPQTEREQAISLVKQYLVYRSWGVKRIFWTSTVEFDWPDEFGAPLGTPGNPQHYFSLIGLVHNGKGEGDPGHGVRKLAYHTYRLLVEKLGRADWDRLELVRDDNAVVFRLLVGGKPVYVAWREQASSEPFRLSPAFPGQAGQGPVSVGLGVGGEAARVTPLIAAAKEGKDVGGDRAVFPFRRLETVGGRVMLELSEEPLLIEPAAEARGGPVPEPKEAAPTPRPKEEGTPALVPQPKEGAAQTPVYFYVWLHIHSGGAKPPLHVMPPEPRANLRASLEALSRQRVVAGVEFSDEVVHAMRGEPEILPFLQPRTAGDPLELGYHFHPQTDEWHVRGVFNLEWDKAIRTLAEMDSQPIDVSGWTGKFGERGVLRPGMVGGIPGIKGMERALGRLTTHSSSVPGPYGLYYYRFVRGIRVTHLWSATKRGFWYDHSPCSNLDYPLWTSIGWLIHNMGGGDTGPRGWTAFEPVERLHEKLRALPRNRPVFFMIGGNELAPPDRFEKALRYVREEFLPANPQSRFVTASDLVELFGEDEHRTVTANDLAAAAQALIRDWREADWSFIGDSVPDPSGDPYQTNPLNIRLGAKALGWLKGRGPRPPGDVPDSRGGFLSLTELFEGLATSLAAFKTERSLPTQVTVDEFTLGPIADLNAEPPLGRAPTVTGQTIVDAAASLSWVYPPAYRAVPARVVLGGVEVNAAEFLRAMTEVYLGIRSGGKPPASVSFVRSWPVPDRDKLFDLQMIVQHLPGQPPADAAPTYQTNNSHELVFLWSLRRMAFGALATPLSFADFHLHLDSASEKDASRLIAAMEATGTQIGLILGPPVSVPSELTAWDDAARMVAEQSGGKVRWAVRGFGGDDPQAPAYVARRLDQGAAAIGEFHAIEGGEKSEPFRKVLTEAGKRGVPVCGWVAANETFLKEFPQTRFVITATLDLWRDPQRGIPWERRMLRKHPNLSIALEIGVEEMRTGRVADDLLELIEEFPDRFVLGAVDRHGDMSHLFGLPMPLWRAYHAQLLRRLKPTTAEALRGGNLLRLLKSHSR